MNAIAKHSFPAFSIMVASLFKKIEDGGNPYGTLMHAAVGIVGETIELRAFTDRKNFIEEAGDIEFYLEAQAQAIEYLDGRLPDIAFTLLTFADANADEIFNRIIDCGGAIVDYAKKSWVYRKDVLSEKIFENVTLIRIYLDWLYIHFTTSREEVQYENQVKLIGPDGRFRDGFYSDLAAQQRADKQGELLPAASE